MNVISRIEYHEAVAVISFEKASAHIDFIASLFQGIGEAKINVDMISQTAPRGEHNTLSFTVNDKSVPAVLAIVAKLRDKHANPLLPLVSIGNAKISLYGEDMPLYCGVAADIFVRLGKEEIDTLLITTSSVDISIVVSSANADRAHEIFIRQMHDE